MSARTDKCSQTYLHWKKKESIAKQTFFQRLLISIDTKAWIFVLSKPARKDTAVFLWLSAETNVVVCCFLGLKPWAKFLDPDTGYGIYICKFKSLRNLLYKLGKLQILLKDNKRNKTTSNIYT